MTKRNATKRRPARQRPDTLRCSFCEKHRSEVRALITGPRGSICEKCVVDSYILLRASNTVAAVKEITKGMA